MTRSKFLAVVALLTLTGASALAADVTGKWSATISGDQGEMTINFVFKQDGTKLTGTSQGPQGDPIELKNGKVEGDKISFLVLFDAGGGEMKIQHDGTIKGDEIEMTVKFEGGDMPPIPMKVTRSK